MARSRSTRARKPKVKWNVYVSAGGVDKYLGSSYATTEGGAIRNVWFVRYGREPRNPAVFARRESDEAYHPPELFKKGEQMRLA